MSVLMVTTCGTSLLTNGAPNDLRGLIIRSANARAGDLDSEARRSIDEHIGARRDLLSTASANDVVRLSAELNGVVTWYGGDISGGAGDVHILLATDTYLGEQTAELVAGWLLDKGTTAIVERRRDLATRTLDEFQSAMSELVQWCDDRVTDYRNKGYHVVFNLTGGFKSVNGFLQALGMFYADETVYKFEAGDELLRLPRLPLAIEPTDSVRENLTVLRRLAVRGAARTDELPGLAAVPETLLLHIGDEVSLSAWGEIVWRQTSRLIYREQLWEPLPDDGVRLGSRFRASLRASLRRSEPERMALVNQRLDDLCRHVASGGSANLNRLDLKALRANPSPPSTHECDAWADGDARRIFCHFEEGTIVVDRLGEALH